MDVTKCDECGYEIGIKVDTCPGCGERIGIDIGGFKGVIRRISIIIFAIYILLSSLGFI